MIKNFLGHFGKLVIITSISVAFIGCAKRPQAIAPVVAPTSQYSNLSCNQLTQKLDQERQAFDALSREQNNAATADMVGVFLIAIPLGSVVGQDKEGEVAVVKGKILSIENEIAAKGC